jgi:hypothetical protein
VENYAGPIRKSITMRFVPEPQKLFPTACETSRDFFGPA